MTNLKKGNRVVASFQITCSEVSLSAKTSKYIHVLQEEAVVSVRED